MERSSGVCGSEADATAPTETPAPTVTPAPVPTETPVPEPVITQPVRQVGDLRFGIDEGIRNDAVMADTGAGWQRVVLPWSGMQPDAPTQPLQQTLPNGPIDAALKRGVRVAGLLEFTPAWARENPAAGEGSPPRNLELAYDDPNNYWGRFVFQTARAYAGRIDEWIIGNEPDIRPGDPGVVTNSAGWLGTDAQYAQLLKVAYQAAHAANPNAVVAFAATTYWSDELARRPQFYERVLQLLPGGRALLLHPVPAARTQDLGCDHAPTASFQIRGKWQHKVPGTPCGCFPIANEARPLSLHRSSQPELCAAINNAWPPGQAWRSWTDNLNLVLRIKMNQM